MLGSTSRIIIASFAAYLISQLHDVWATRELAEKVNAFIDRRFGHP
ncbi:MAG: VUT family protein [Desulfobacterales bacterium]|nr:MAG: VUT family protein [Desulfobacterales bacterium]